LHPLQILDSQWDILSINFIIELPLSSSYDTVMTVVDLVLKKAHFILTHMTVTAEEAARLFLHQVWKLHGLLKCIILDHGPQFIARFTKELYRLLGIKLVSSMAWYPQTDRQTEHVNQELDQYLWLFVNKQQDNWYDLLPLVEFQHNNHVHSTTQQPPFLLDTGRLPFYYSDVSKQPIRTRSLSLKCAELRCKKKSALADILAY